MMLRDGRQQANGTPPRARPLILVIERDKHMRELAGHFLVTAGYAVELALDGQFGLEQARTLLPDLVVTEIMIPGIDGLALCRQLKVDSATRHIPVLVFSMLAANGRAREAGADAFLLKPLAEHRLLATVKTLLEARLATTNLEQSS